MSNIFEIRREKLLQLPKVELHLHLEGAIRLTTLADLCDELNLDIPNNEVNSNYKYPSNSDSKIELRDLTPYRNYFCIPDGQNVDNISIFFENFMHTQSLIHSENILERISYEICEDAYNNGVRLLEIRYSPSFIMLTINDKIDHSKMTYSSIYNAIITGIQKAQNRYDIAVGLIGIFDRTKDANDQIPIFHHFYHECHMVHAIDLAADESYSCIPFVPFYNEEIIIQTESMIITSESDSPCTSDIDSVSVSNSTNLSITSNSAISSTKTDKLCSGELSTSIPTSNNNNHHQSNVSKRSNRFGKTCHAGESTTHHTVIEAIKYLNVTRIGHGFLSIQDDDLLNQIIHKNIHLEICPISNIRTGSVKNIYDHPIRSLFDRGVSLSINSDDPGIFDSSIIEDYELCMDHHNFTLQELYDCNKQALSASFLPEVVKEKIRLKYFDKEYYEHEHCV